MNILKVKHAGIVRALAIAAIGSVLLVNCASTPQSPPGAADVRAKLTGLQTDSNLGSRAPTEIEEAEAAVRLAEVPAPRDKALGAHRVQMADYKVELAIAKARTRFAEDQRVQLSEQREHARLLARTREADLARSQADMARYDARRAREDADAARASEANAASNAARQAELARIAAEDARILAAADAAKAARQVESAQDAANRARNEADAARAVAATSAADAERQKAELQRQIDLLQAKTTDRGLVLTLGSVLFATGRAELKSGATNTLDKLVSFLNQYPDRNVVIEGHTDNVGTSTSNQALSERRAGSVKSYLLQQGILSQRLVALGIGEDQPVANNDSAAGRQQNRRVEIIIENPPAVASTKTESR